MRPELFPITVGSEFQGPVESLYTSAFPEVERAPMGNLLEMSDGEGFSFLAVCDDGIFRGFTYLIHKDDIVFVLYLAIEGGSRSAGYGSAALDLVRGLHPQARVFLNIEPPSDAAGNREQRERRRAFYLRNGFLEHGIVNTPDGEKYLMMETSRITDEELLDFYTETGTFSLFST